MSEVPWAGHEIEHQSVWATRGGGMCPEQHEGRLSDGRHFYLRLRHSEASLGVGVDEDGAVADWDAVFEEIDEARADRGWFTDNAELNTVFARLLQKRAPELAPR